jgi:hypothetical protein
MIFLGYLRATRHLPRVARGLARPKQRSGGQDTEEQWTIINSILSRIGEDLLVGVAIAVFVVWSYCNCFGESQAGKSKSTVRIGMAKLLCCINFVRERVIL